MEQELKNIEKTDDMLAKEYTEAFFGEHEKKPKDEEILGRNIDIDFMFFTTDFISRSLKESGFEKIETIERESSSEVKYQSRRAYGFATEPVA